MKVFICCKVFFLKVCYFSFVFFRIEKERVINRVEFFYLVKRKIIYFLIYFSVLEECSFAFYVVRRGEGVRRKYVSFV